MHGRVYFQSITSMSACWNNGAPSKNDRLFRGAFAEGSRTLTSVHPRKLRGSSVGAHAAADAAKGLAVHRMRSS